MDDGKYSGDSRKKLWIGLGLIVFAAIVASLWLYLRPSHKAPVKISPVPVSIASAVNFKVYYPDQKKMPVGYHLDLASFKNPVKNGVAYTVSYGTNKRIVFSVQVRPTDAELQTFNSSYIPLRIDYQTPVGLSEIGAYHSQTLVSLPVLNGPWIVITAPPDINQTQLKQVLSALIVD